MSRRVATLSRLSPESIELMKNLKHQGYAWKEIAEVLGATEHQCRYFGGKLGLSGIKPVQRVCKPKMAAVQPAKPLPEGATTLPPLPCLQEPIYIIQNK